MRLPAHRRETVDKERRDQLSHAVIGTMPRHEPLAVFDLTTTKTDERFHSMRVMANLLVPTAQQADILIGEHLQQPRCTVSQPPEHPVEHVPT